MSISAISVGVGLEAIFNHHHRGQTTTDASDQSSDTSQSSQAQSQSASSDTVNQAQNALAALLSSLLLGTNSQGSGDTSQSQQSDMGPPPPLRLAKAGSRTPSQTRLRVCCSPRSPVT